ncbi:hypothetical protein [Microbacterium sp. CJ88]|uniref:hypothetical protein n=1 Tax=Microbacterium sp. CJ88 TaxID=3445672 RepID=UPI003F656B7E
MTNPPPVSRGMERGILILFMAAAAVIGLGLAVPAAQQAIGVATGAGGISMLTDAAVPHTDAVAGAAISSATFDSAWVVASGLDGGTRALLALGASFGAVPTALTVGAVVLFLLLMMWRRPFHRALIVATQVAGAALLIGGILSAGLGGLGRMMAATELNPVAGDVFVVGFRFDPAWMLVGVGVLALSFVFSYGTRLQRDTEGLV